MSSWIRVGRSAAEDLDIRLLEGPPGAVLAACALRLELLRVSMLEAQVGDR